MMKRTTRYATALFRAVRARPKPSKYISSIDQLPPGLVVLYGRVSSRSQKKKLLRQVNHLKRELEARGFTVIAVYCEIVPGWEYACSGRWGRVKFECAITALRLQLLEQVQERDWRKLPNEEIRRLLIFLFGENPNKTGNGITVFREKNRWRISFKGMVEFHHELSNGRPLSHVVKKAAVRYNEDAKRRIQERVALTRQT
jgi:hypothetical protein